MNKIINKLMNKRIIEINLFILLRSCFWNVSNTENNKCDTTKGKTISCSNLGSDVCDTGVGNIENNDCILNGSVCIEHKSCSQLDSSDCESRSALLIKDNEACIWIKVYLFKKKKV
jgi:hypothetical protein